MTSHPMDRFKHEDIDREFREECPNCGNHDLVDGECRMCEHTEIEDGCTCNYCVNGDP